MKLMMRIGVLVVFLLLMGSVIATEKDTETNMDKREDDSHANIARVKIKVFRGPTEEQNGQKFAPWGFWIKQPSGQ